MFWAKGQAFFFRQRLLVARLTTRVTSLKIAVIWESENRRLALHLKLLEYNQEPHAAMIKVTRAVETPAQT